MRITRLSAAAALGLDLQTVSAGIGKIEGVPGRLERISAGQDFSVLVDYAHTPDALEKLLQTASEIPHARVITVFGCGGDRDRRKRPMMGRIAARSSDLVIATSDNPRSENPAAILAEIEAGLKEGPAAYEVILDRRAAIGRAIGAAAPKDIVLIAGKGHEDYQIIGSRSTRP